MNTITEFEEEGCAVVESVLPVAEAERIAEALDSFVFDGAGARGVLASPAVRAVVERLRCHPIVGKLVSPQSVAVQCTIFEKSAARNWLVAPH